VKRAPVCCIAGCDEPRMPPEPYCAVHENEAVITE
jgi:hypothetical protein